MRNVVITVAIITFGSVFHDGFQGSILNLPKTVIENYFNSSSFMTNSHYLQDNQLTSFWTCIIAIKQIGQLIGATVTACIADSFGRRKMLILAAIPYLLGCAFQTLAGYLPNQFQLIVFLFIIGRLLVGIFGEIMIIIVPVFIVEISPIKIRGRLSTISAIMITVGNLFGMIVTLDITLGDENRWRYVFLLPIAGILLQTLYLLIFCPESPIFLMQHLNDRSKAKQSIKFFLEHNCDDIENELNHLLNNQNQDTSAADGDDVVTKTSNQKKLQIWQLLVSKTLRHQTLLTVAIAVCVAFSGLSVMVSYSTSMFDVIAKLHHWAKYSSITLAAMLLVGTVISITTVDKIGRKPLLISSCWLMTTSLIGCLLLWTVHQYHPYHIIPYISLAFIFTWALAFAVGVCPIGFFVTSEIFSTNERTAAQSLRNIIISIASILLLFIYLTLQNLIKSYVLLIFIVPLMLATAYITKTCPETKNKNINVIIKERRITVDS